MKSLTEKFGKKTIDYAFEEVYILTKILLTKVDAETKSLDEIWKTYNKANIEEKIRILRLVVGALNRFLNDDGHPSQKQSETTPSTDEWVKKNIKTKADQEMWEALNQNI